MAMSTTSSSRWRNDPFNRESASPSPASPSVSGRPKSMNITSSPATAGTLGHNRNQSFSPLSGSNLAPARTTRQRSSSNRSNTQVSSTFAPNFIKTEELQQNSEAVRGIEGENDFSGKRYVWVKDNAVAFVKGWVVDDRGDGQLLVQCDDGVVGSTYVKNTVDY